MISSDEQFLAEHRVAMNVRAMQEAIADLLAMAGDKYGLPYVMRDARDLESLADDLEQLILLLEYNRLQKVS